MTPKARTVTNVANNSSMAPHPFITFESISRTNNKTAHPFITFESLLKEGASPGAAEFQTRKSGPATGGGPLTRFNASSGRTRRNSPYAEAPLPRRNFVTQAVID